MRAPLYFLTQKADTFVMVIVNILAILYLYNQFVSLRKTGSKYLLSELTHIIDIVQFMKSELCFCCEFKVMTFVDSFDYGMNLCGKNFLPAPSTSIHCCISVGYTFL